MMGTWKILFYTVKIQIKGRDRIKIFLPDTSVDNKILNTDAGMINN
jgi:hypothetical protein